jgi:hypothetical protein
MVSFARVNKAPLTTYDRLGRARLAVGAATTLASFFFETHAARTAEANPANAEAS